jgi:hypothetical protein
MLFLVRSEDHDEHGRKGWANKGPDLVRTVDSLGLLAPTRIHGV